MVDFFFDIIAAQAPQVRPPARSPTSGNTPHAPPFRSYLKQADSSPPQNSTAPQDESTAPEGDSAAPDPDDAPERPPEAARSASDEEHGGASQEDSSADSDETAGRDQEAAQSESQEREEQQGEASGDQPDETTQAPVAIEATAAHKLPEPDPEASDGEATEAEAERPPQAIEPDQTIDEPSRPEMPDVGLARGELSEEGDSRNRAADLDAEEAARRTPAQKPAASDELAAASEEEEAARATRIVRRDERADQQQTDRRGGGQKEGRFEVLDVKAPREATRTPWEPHVEATSSPRSEDSQEPAPSRASEPPPPRRPEAGESRVQDRFAQHLLARGGEKPAKGVQLSGAQQTRFVDRVARAFHAAEGRGGPLRLRLHPPELGGIKLEVRVHSGGLSARVETETPAARSLLLDNLPVLRERLAEQGMRVDQFDVELPDRHSGDSPESFDGQKGTSRQPRESDPLPQDESPEEPSPIDPSPREQPHTDQLNVVI